MWLKLMTSKVGFHKISLKHVPPSEPISEFEYCQIGMAAIAMGDVNAVYTLESAHRRQLLAARALNERSLFITGRPFPRTKTIGDVYIVDLVILSVLQFSDVHVDSSPIEVQRADALHEFPPDAHECGQVGQYTLGRNLGRTARRRFWHTRILP